MSDIEKVKKLREATGAGFKDCNLAIKESKGDLDKAVEILRVKGISKASKKMSRDAKEGVIAVSGDDKKISLIEVNCETDFVAKNEDFINFVKELSDLRISTLKEFIKPSVKIKKDVVLKDPREKNLRKILNFGHTLGHAIESYFLNNPKKNKLLHEKCNCRSKWHRKVIRSKNFKPFNLWQNWYS